MAAVRLLDGVRLRVMNVARYRGVVVDVPLRNLAALEGQGRVGRFGDRNSGDQQGEYETDHEAHADVLLLKLYTV